MAADALPAPITTRLPAGGSGRCNGTQRAGWAAAMAAANMFCSNSRGLIGMPENPPWTKPANERFEEQRVTLLFPAHPRSRRGSIMAKRKITGDQSQGLKDKRHHSAQSTRCRMGTVGRPVVPHATGCSFAMRCTGTARISRQAWRLWHDSTRPGRRVASGRHVRNVLHGRSSRYDRRRHAAFRCDTRTMRCNRRAAARHLVPG